jgi:hypothetical protein
MYKYINIFLSVSLAYSLYVIYNLQNKKKITKNTLTNTDPYPINNIVESKSSQTFDLLVESKSSQTLELLTVDLTPEPCGPKMYNFQTTETTLLPLQPIQTNGSDSDSDYEKLDTETENEWYDMIPCNNSKKRTGSFINRFFI